MKHINKFMLLAFIVLGLASCKKRNNSLDGSGDIKPVTITVKLAFDADNTIFGFTFEKAVVKATNLTTSQAYTATVSTDGNAVFKDITPGSYNVTTTLNVAAADYNTKAGTNLQDAVVYNGSLSNQSMVQNGDLALVIKTGRVGDFVLKQIYYAGSNATNGAVFRDQFIEIYNNSTTTLYADSLYIAQVMGNNTAPASVDQTKGFYLPSGQFDWTKSIDMSNPAANTNYVYAKTMFMIPGTGKQYPVLPGKSIIVAATAINHQAPFTGITGTVVTVKDPSLTIDLSTADFEVYLGNYPGINPLSSDLDNPAVTNVTVIHNISNRDLIIDALGRDGVVIFKSAVDPQTWTKYATPEVTQIVAATNLYIQVPISVITDGVGIQHAVAASRVAKRIPDVVDAGEISVPGGSYSSQSIVRKTSKTVNGRIVLKDTNNSANDFGTLIKADPSKSATSFVN